MSAELVASELLWQTTDPGEIPLVMPSWARNVPIVAERIDARYELRRAAGLPIDRVACTPAPWTHSDARAG